MPIAKFFFPVNIFIQLPNYPLTPTCHFGGFISLGPPTSLALIQQLIIIFKTGSDWEPV